VSGYYDAKVSLGGMTQICVASGLVVDVEAGTHRARRSFLGVIRGSFGIRMLFV
jgi:hypothetical protein